MVAQMEQTISTGGGANGQTNHDDSINGTHIPQYTTPIAIVGMACRFPDNVTSPAKLWDLCAEGRDSRSPIPKDGSDIDSPCIADGDRPGGRHAKCSYFSEAYAAAFDARFPGIAADVSSAMDPQTRMMLEIVYEATEDAGIPIESLTGTKTSVFLGCHGKDSHILQMQDSETMQSPLLTSNSTSVLSNCISHFYGLHGASMSINTDCSSSRACLHRACQTICSGESEVSIVGAVNTILGPDSSVAMSIPSLDGTDGRCHACDERAQPWGRSEGVAALVLKSLDAAVRDGDRVHCIIRATSLNQDGRTQGIGSPSIDSQVHLIREAYGRANLDPCETGYIEAQIIGTHDSSLAEARALAEAFGTRREASGPVLVGSVETNIGHTGPVSGLAAIIKAAFAMKNRQVAANLNLTVPDPKVKLDDWHLKIPTDSMPWPPNRPLRASINILGCCGTNSHVILEAAPPETQDHANTAAWNGEEGEDENLSRVFILSAEDAETARNMAKNLATYLRNGIKKGEKLSPADVAYTLAERRSRLSCRAAVQAKSLVELVDGLDRLHLKTHTTREKKRLGFVFNGQGAQWHAMGRELLTTYPVFASAVKEADAVLRSYGADWSLQEELMRDAESTRVSELHISQPSTVALQLSLVELLRSWNIHASAVVSHSTGEVAAAFTAGALSFSQALGIAYHLGDLGRKYHRLSAQVGGMAAAGLSAKDAEKYIADMSADGRVVVACINSPGSVTLSGDMDGLDEMVSRLDRDGIFVRKLKVPLAYHSHQMLPMASEYTERLRQILPSKPTWTGDVAYASPVTGAMVDSPHVLTPEHYVRNITSPVLFSDAFSAISESLDEVVEIGPHSTLSGPIREILDGREVGYVSCLRRPVDAVNTMQDLACDLLGFGYPVSLRGVNPGTTTTTHKFVPDLPAYPWEHSSGAPTSGTECSPGQTEPEVSRSKSYWELDVLHDFPKPIKDSMRITLTQDEIDLEKTLVRASYYFISDAVLQLRRQDQEGWTAHHKDMFEWMEATVASGKKGSFGPGSAMWSRASRGMKQALYDELNQGHDAPGRLIARVGAKLTDILRGQITPLELMMEGKYYMELPRLRSRSNKHLSRATELFAIKNPGAKVLEIGAGTGGATRAVLDGFGSRAGNTGGTLLGHYLFTDIDPSSIEAARQSLASWDRLIEFHRLDIEKDPNEQSDAFAAGTFDLIVASMVLHGTRSLGSALTHARKLLKPGGKLFLVETTRDKLDVQLIFRTMPERWSGEQPLRSTSPIISNEAWDEILRDTGFTGVDFEIGDCEQHQFQSSSFIVSTAATTPTLPSAVCVVYTAPVPEAWHGQLAAAILENTSITSVTAEIWDELEPEDKMYIFTGDMAAPFIEGMDQASFSKLRRFLRSSRKVLWLSHGGSVGAQDPAYAQTYGLLRTLRQEDASKRYIHLDFEQTGEGPWTSNNIGHIVHVLRQAMDEKAELQDVDWEYGVKDSMLHVPRIFPGDIEAEALEPGQQPLHQLDDPNATFLVVNGLGGIGQEVALWMMGKGARNLLIVSRDAERHAGAAVLMKTAEQENCNVQVRDCDVSSEESLINLLIYVGSSMPPIRGVVVAPMILDDAVLERVTFDQWKHVVVPKVAGTAYLDTYLPPRLRFFILLSSLAGVVGHPLETDFSAGSTFQDVFARNRVASGKPFTSIDLGKVSGLGGVVGDDYGVESVGMELSSTSISIEDVLSLIEEAIRRQPATPADAQVIVGLQPWSKLAPEAPMWRDQRFGTMRLGIRRAISALEPSSETQTLSPSDLLVQALKASGKDRTGQAVALALQARLAALLHIKGEEIDLAQPLAAYGVDSLIAVELRSWLATAGSAKLSVLEISNAVSLHEVAELVITRNNLE